MKDAIEIIQEEIDANNIVLENESLWLTSSSDMSEVNQVADKVRRMVRVRSGEIKTILSLSIEEQNLELSNVNSESTQGKQIVKVIFGNQKEKKGFTYDALIKRINAFVTGSEYESIMSNYNYLISNKIKDEKTKDYYSIEDADELISKASNKIIEGQQELDSEKKWKEKRRIIEMEIQDKNSKNRGDNLETLIENFNRSMPLLKIREK
jgi:ribosomal protein L3